jgi:hypothetical protein
MRADGGLGVGVRDLETEVLGEEEEAQDIGRIEKSTLDEGVDEVEGRGGAGGGGEREVLEHETDGGGGSGQRALGEETSLRRQRFVAHPWLPPGSSPEEESRVDPFSDSLEVRNDVGGARCRVVGSCRLVGRTSSIGVRRDRWFDRLD